MAENEWDRMIMGFTSFIFTFIHIILRMPCMHGSMIQVDPGVTVVDDDPFGLRVEKPGDQGADTTDGDSTAATDTAKDTTTTTTTTTTNRGGGSVEREMHGSSSSYILYDEDQTGEMATASMAAQTITAAATAITATTISEISGDGGREDARAGDLKIRQLTREQQRREQRHRIVSVGGAPFDEGRDYVVALPRNLLKGFCNIEPLVRWAEAAEQEELRAAVRSLLLLFMYNES